MRLALIGPPGAGKGTQGDLLAARQGMAHIATGRLIRDEIARGTPLGRAIEKQIGEGYFVSDEQALALLTSPISRAGETGFVLDGCPRTVEQAEALEEIPAWRPERVIAFDLDEAHLIERLAGRWVCAKCGASYHETARPPKETGTCDTEGERLRRRPEDAADVIRLRFALYAKATLPVIEFYEKIGRLRRIDASGEPEEVYSCLTSALA
jgi:adenylate kinase